MSSIGYKNGKPFGLTLVPIGRGFYLSENAALDFNKMADEADRLGHHIREHINTAFRTMEEQTRLWKEHEAGTRKSAVARPGFSNHQAGTAVDISVNGAPLRLAYLRDNAHRFNFKNDVASEPWHWHWSK